METFDVVKGGEVVGSLAMRNLSEKRACAVVLRPRNEIVDPSMDRNQADAYVNRFNRIMDGSGIFAEVVDQSNVSQRDDGRCLEQS